MKFVSIARLVVLGLALGLFLASEAGAYTVRSDHPRLFLTESMLPGLRTRCATTHASQFARLRTWVDDQKRMSMKNSYYCDDYAFLYVMTLDAGYRDWAIEATLYNAKRGTEVGGEGGAIGRLSSIALAYDWLYDAMTPAQRDTVGRAFVNYVQNGKPNYQTAAAWLPYDIYMGYALAIHGDGLADADAAAGLDISYRRFTERFIPALDEVGTNGAVDGYAGERTEGMFTLAELLRSATGENWAAQSSFIRNSGAYWMGRLRGDLRLSRTPGKWNMANTNVTEYFSYFASISGNPNWQYLANQFVGDTTSWDPTTVWSLILWWNPATAATWPPETLSYRDPGAGMVLMRDSWDIGPSSRAIHAGFFCGPDLVHNKTQGHFLIARGSDNLMIDSGSYQHDLDDHYMPYYSRAIAHNTILVVNPAETFGTWTNYYNETFNIPNDGGQGDSDHTLGCQHYPRAECTYGYRGEISRYNDTGEYVYARADMSSVYSSSKAASVVREFVYVRPDIFVIRDHVQRMNASYATKSVFHMIDRPAVDGALTVVAGNLSTGGVFETTNGRTALVTRGTSQCRLHFVKPASSSGVLRVIGGGNAQGQAWRQNWTATDELTYDASTSYEFWVDGRNYISCGPLCSQQEIDSRNTLLSNEAGDWRLEIQAPATGTSVTLLTVMKVGPLGEAALDVRSYDTPTGEAVAIARAPGDTVVVAFAKSEGLQEVRY